MNEIVNCAAYSEGRKVADVDLKDISDLFENTKQFIWVGLHEPSGETLSLFQKQFHLHDLAIEDARNAHQRPKIERYGDTLFVVLRTAKINNIFNRIDLVRRIFLLAAGF